MQKLRILFQFSMLNYNLSLLLVISLSSSRVFAQNYSALI